MGQGPGPDRAGSPAHGRASARRRYRLRAVAGLCLACLASACVTARLHGPEELSALERSCDLAQGEIVQEAEEPKVLILYAIAPSRPKIACVARWARKNHLHLAYIQAVNWQDH
jgi:hypothetical protein